MPGRYGSASVWFLVDGYDILTSKLQELRYTIAALLEPSAGLGDTTKQRAPTGLSEVSVAQSGGFFDTTANGPHAALRTLAATPQDSERILCLGFAGHTLGERFLGCQGSFSSEYEVLASFGGLTKANAAHAVTGQADQGVILHPLGAETIDVNGTAVDNLASSANGGVGYLQVTSITGLTGALIKVQHSADNAVWADLVSFTNVTTGPTKQRLAVAGTINRYLRYTVDVTGVGSIVFFVGFSRG